MAKRVAFVTIGQSPRSDLVAELLAQTRAPPASAPRVDFEVVRAEPVMQDVA